MSEFVLPAPTEEVTQFGSTDPRQLILPELRSPVWTVLLAGGGRLFRETLKLSLELEKCVVVEALDINQLRSQLRPTAAPTFLLHCHATENSIASELSIIREIKAGWPSLRVLVLAKTIDTQLVKEVMRSDIQGLMLLDTSLRLLRSALQIMSVGQHTLPLHLTNLLDQPDHIRATTAHQQVSAQPAPYTQRTVSLSARETQILSCLVDGSSNKSIARKLMLAEATVKVHVKALLRKLQVANRTQAAIWALSSPRSHAAQMKAEDRQCPSGPSAERRAHNAGLLVA